MRDWRSVTRKKLLSLLPRTALEELSTQQSPWHATRDTLLTEVIAAWPQDDVREAVDKAMEDLWRRANAE